MTDKTDPDTSGTGRDAARRRFLADAGLSSAEVVALAPDASFRRYFRVRGAGEPALLMDAPPPGEDVAPFVRVDEHLRELGLAAPRILGRDEKAGLLLLEDFGDDTFTRLLAAGHDAAPLYRMALDALVALQCHPRAAAIEVPAYNLDVLLDETALLPDWHYRLIHGRSIDSAARAKYLDAWRGAFRTLPPPALTLVLRDFHVDNLMLVSRGGAPTCGLLDFQDALIGPVAYDVASLLQDARRDIPADFETEFVEYYLERMPLMHRENFLAWYDMLAAQRHAKVVGIFSRLCLRDGKCAYLRHLPRVIRLLERGLRIPALAPLKGWLDRHLPARLDYKPSTNETTKK